MSDTGETPASPMDKATGSSVQTPLDTSTGLALRGTFQGGSFQSGAPDSAKSGFYSVMKVVVPIAITILLAIFGYYLLEVVKPLSAMQERIGVLKEEDEKTETKLQKMDEDVQGLKVDVRLLQEIQNKK
jgi:hypothetical protein